MTDAGPTRVLIVGGGTAGWMTAAALSTLLPRGTASLGLVESAEIGTVGVGEATVPHIRFFNARLGIDESDFMRRTQATFKLGIEFCDWSRVGDAYIHPFGAFGRDFAQVGFHQHWLRAHRAGCAGSMQDYSLPVLAARSGRFAHPSTDFNSVRSTYSYAYQFDAGLYAAYLRSVAETRGVTRTEGRIVDVGINESDGFVRNVRLEDGAVIEADLFIDCSGFRGVLIEQSLAAGYENWSHWLPCDRAYAAPCKQTRATSPYTRSTARNAGWIWRIPLQHRIGNGHVYASEFISDEDALQALLADLESSPTMDPKKLRFVTGKRRKQWSRNVVAIGLSAGFLEPLESTSIHLIQLAIGYLLDLFPDRQFDAANEFEFNRIMALEYERIRDFLILHYYATERDDSPFWNYCRNMSIPDSLRARMQLFRERGVVPHYREGMFLDASWLAVYFGQRIIPEHYDPIANRVPKELLMRHLEELKVECTAAVSEMPTHDAFLQKCGASARVPNAS